MLPIAIVSAVLAIVAAVFALSTTPSASAVWFAVVIGSVALTCGSLVCRWADPNAPRATKRRSTKIVVATVATILLLPAIVMSLALFTFTLFPALVIILPLIAGWDFGALRPVTPTRVPLVPRHA